MAVRVLALKKLKKLREYSGFLGVALLTLLELIVVGMVICKTAPARRTSRLITAGERDLAALDYDEAAATFRRALEIDPQSERGRRAVRDHMEQILVTADQASLDQDYDTAVHLSGLVQGFGDILGDDDLMVRVADERREKYAGQKEIAGLLGHAESEFSEGNWKNAATYYDLAADKGADQSVLEPNRSISRVYGEIISLAGGDHDEELVKLLDGTEYTAVADTTGLSGRHYIGDDILIERDGDNDIVIYGGLSRDSGEGTATAVISAGNTYSVYSGEWNGFKPEGNGDLSIWLKSENEADSAVFSGTFHEGLCNGAERYRDRDLQEILIEISEGTVPAGTAGVDASVYIAGVCGFGGSDDKPVIESAPAAADWRSIPGTSDPSYAQAAAVLDSLDWDIEAAFDWSAGLTYYGHGKADMPETAAPGTCWFAEFGFTNLKGNCFVMAATFYEFAKLCGYEPRQMCGMVPSRKGGLTIHSWVEMDFDGQTYVYDPDFQYNKGLDGFGLQYGQQGTWRYQDYSEMSE